MDENKKQIELSGTEKTGAFIKLLRVSHNLTQEELGDMIYVTRKAVSKWENGICYPSIDLIPRIADLFGVSLEEILAGEFNCDEESDLSTFDYVVKVFRNKHIKVTIKSIIILIIFCLLIFFFENYNATKIYDVYYEDADTYVKNGIIISTRSKQYFNFGNIIIENKDKKKDSLVKCRLYLKMDNQEKTLATYSMNSGSYYTGIDYKELDAADISNNLDNLWLSISYIDNRGLNEKKKIHLKTKLRYKSNDFIQFKSAHNNIIDFNHLLNKQSGLKPINLQYDFKSRTAIDISYIYNMSEADRILEFNKKVNGLEVQYSNNILGINDDKYILEINLESSTYLIKQKINSNIIIKNKKIVNKKLFINLNLSANKTSKFTNKIVNYLNSR